MIDILTMPAGDEIDALVASRIMIHAWCYSSDLSLAFSVQSEMHRRGYHLQLKSPFLPDHDTASTGHIWFAGFTPHGMSGWNGRPDFVAFGDIAPLAICRAALLTVGVE